MASYDPAAVAASADPTAAAMSTSAAVPPKSKGGALYHCDYCRKDISSLIRVKCAVCSDFDLCLECFCSGVQVGPHRNSHAYRIIEHVRTPLFDPRWGADEELLLLEAIELFGFGNWSDIADHVSTKSKADCEQHYNTTYLQADTAPLPDVSKALVHIKQETVQAENSTASSSSTLPSSSSPDAMQVDSSPSSSAPPTASTTPSSLLKSKPLPPPPSSSSSSSPSKPTKPAHTPLPSKPKPKSGLGHLVGYIPNRGDFDAEYENDAELILADMEFKEEDTRWERELKLKVVEVYGSKLDARSERKRFILERGLLERKEKKRGKEEREIWNNMRVFARFHSAEEHEQFIAGLANEARLRRRIERLQTWRMNGVKSLKEGERYEEEKKRREDKKRSNGLGTANAQLTLPHTHAAASSSKKRGASELLDDASSSSAAAASSSSSSAKLPKTVASLPPFPIESMDSSELLSEKEKALCCTLQLLPVHYLAIKQRLMAECFTRGFLKEGQARQLIRIDVNKSRTLFDFFVSVGWCRDGEEGGGGQGEEGAVARHSHDAVVQSM